jgi:hypothetical protein
MGHSHSKASGHQSPAPYSSSAQDDLGTDFIYAPLKHPRYIRVLHLTNAEHEKQAHRKDIFLRGTLVETYLNAVPKYLALSYTWGDPTLSEVILLDGKTLKITQSCAAALRCMLHGKSEILIWVDSICINQAGMCTQDRWTHCIDKRL